ILCFVFFFFQAEDGIRDPLVTGVQTCALPIFGEFPAQLDSGADRTVILQEHVERLQLAAVRQIPIVGFGSETRLLSTYAVKIQRSEERRVGKEWRCVWLQCCENEKEMEGRATG